MSLLPGKVLRLEYLGFLPCPARHIKRCRPDPCTEFVRRFIHRRDDALLQRRLAIPNMRRIRGDGSDGEAVWIEKRKTGSTRAIGAEPAIVEEHKAWSEGTRIWSSASAALTTACHDQACIICGSERDGAYAQDAVNKDAFFCGCLRLCVRPRGRPQ